MQFYEFFKKERNIALVLLFVVLLAKLPTMGLEYHWDAILYSKQAEFYSINGPLAIPEGRIAHVPLLQWITAVPFGLIGESPFTSHLVIALFSFIGIFYAYKIGKLLKGNKAGFMAAAFVFFMPAYFSISGQFLFDVPVTAATIAAVYYFIKGDLKGYILSASTAVFLKESGILIVGAAILYAVFKERKKIPLYASPLLFTILWQLWMSFNRPVSGFLIPSGLAQIPMRLIASIYNTLFINYMWILILPIVYCFYKNGDIWKGKSFILPLTIVVYILFFGLVPIFILPRYFLPAAALVGVMSAISLSSIKKNKIIAPIICLLLVSTYFWHDGIKGVAEDPLYRSIYQNKITALKTGEMTMDYIGFVESEKEAIDYIIENYKGKIVAAKFPIYEPEMISIDVGKRQWIANRIKVVPPEESEKADILIEQSCCPVDNKNWIVIEEFGNGIWKVKILKNPNA